MHARRDAQIVETDASYVARRTRFRPDLLTHSAADPTAHAELRYGSFSGRVLVPGRYSPALVQAATFGLGLGGMAGCLSVILWLAPDTLTGQAIVALCALAVILVAFLTYVAGSRYRE